MDGFGRNMGRKMGIGVLTFCLLLIAAPAGAQEGFMESLKRMEVHGYLDNFSILRSDTFKQDYHIATSRYRGSVQVSGPLNLGWTLFGLPISRMEYFVELRPEYESVYDVTDRFGKGRDPDTIATSGRSFPVRPAGATASMYGLLTAFGYNPHDFGAIWDTDKKIILTAHRLSPGVQYPRHKRGEATFPFLFKESQNDLRFGMTRSNNFDLYYPVREAYADIYFDLFGLNWLRIGKQQHVWGKADFFRLQDIVNPVDFAQHFFIDPFDDTRVPYWSVLLEHRFGSVGPLRDVAGSIVWVFDRYTPLGFGNAAQPWAIGFGRELDSFVFSSQLFGEALFPGEDIEIATTVGGHEPDWNLKNSGIGTRWEWLWGNFRFQLTDWFAFQDVPAFGWDRVHVIELPGCMEALPPAGSGETGRWGPEGGRSLVTSGGTPVRVNVKPKKIRVREAPIVQDVVNSPHVADIFANRCGFGGPFVARYRKVNTLGLSVDWFEPLTGMVFRTETSWTANLLQIDTNRADWWADTNRFMWVLGVDRPTFFRLINPTRSFFLSAQAFGTHFPDHSAGRRGGAQGAQSNFIFTALAQSQWMRDQLIGLIFGAYGTTGQDATLGGNVEYLVTNHWSVQLGVTAFLGSRQEHSNSYFSPFHPDGSGPLRTVFGTSVTPFTETALGIAHMQAGGSERNQMDEFWGRIRYRF